MRKSSKIILVVLVGLGLIAPVAYVARDSATRQFFKPTDTKIQQGITQADNQVIADQLSIPWEIVFLPGGSELLVTERTGNLRLIASTSKSIPVSGVEHIGEGGLLGMALHPDFKENQWVYLYLTTRSGENLINRVERYKYDAGALSDKQTILEGIPGASFHDGGRIAFGPDNLLYITTGDAGDEQLAQDTKSLSGKILRVTDVGDTPTDNPFGNPVYSYGHRNPQGIAWDSDGRLWSSEHGRSGLKSGFDEINLIKKGSNYGWPEIEGDEMRDGMVSPALHSGSDETWAPGGLAFADGSLFFGGLRGQTLYQARLDGDKITSIKSNLTNTYGRIRASVAGQDGRLYISTSNTDGRGEAKQNDDKVISIDSTLFK